MRSGTIVASCILLGFGTLPLCLHAQKSDQPEPVMVILHAKAGEEKELEQVIAQHWASAVRLNLVFPAPHLTLREPEEGNKTSFVEIFTWREARAPDAAPEEITKLWDQMNRLVEARNGKPGLLFVPVSIVTK